MIGDLVLDPPAPVSTRPVSAVSGGVGVAGLAGMLAWLAVAFHYRMDGPYAALVNVLACGIAMVGWSVLVDKVHRNPSTGIDWANPRPWRETLDLSLTKLAGLWATWAGIGIVYGLGRFWWQGGYVFAMQCLGVAAPILFALSIPYVIWLDRRLVSPKDGAWQLGAWLMNLDVEIDRQAIAHHLRAWSVKAFFLAFMLAILPGGYAGLIRYDMGQVLTDPVRLAQFLITFMFVIDVGFATVGYILTMRPLDSHIRQANPLAAAWMAALICYPPFVLMGPGMPLDYHPGTHDEAGWLIWLAGHPLFQALIGAMLVVLTGIYAWATVAFGLRFSNLTHRGIVTHGPYAWSRHPAYLAKNSYWWLATLPMFSTGSMVDAARATGLMAIVAGVYYWRAKTEEAHLGTDPAYEAYWHWAEAHAPVPRFFRWLRGLAT